MLNQMDDRHILKKVLQWGKGQQENFKGIAPRAQTAICDQSMEKPKSTSD